MKKLRLALLPIVLLSGLCWISQVSGDINGYSTTTIPAVPTAQKADLSARFNWQDYLPSPKTCAWIQKTSITVLKGMLFTITADLVAQGHPEAAVAFASILEFYTPQELICAATVYQAGSYIQNVSQMVGDALPRIPNLSKAAKIAIEKALKKAVNSTLETMPDLSR